MADPVLRLDSTSVSVEPGGQAQVVVSITSASSIVEGFALDVVGPEPFPIPPYSRDWGETGPREVLAEGARRMMIEVEPAAAGPGALVLFRMKPRAIAKHVGIVTGPDTFLHAYERLGVIEEPLTPSWRRRIAFAFLFPQR